MSNYDYVGTELELFADARRWKGYLRRKIAPYLGPEVLEVGAGIGTTTAALCDGKAQRWVCLEPDANLAARLRDAIAAGTLPLCCEATIGTVDTVPESPAFDTALYIDVLEHIEDDRMELERVARRLKPGGRVVVLAPAHPFLYSPFDRSIGHFRRYTRRTMSDLRPPGLEFVAVRYLDSVGLLASLGNRLLLRQGMPTAGQVAFWDRVLVRASESFDPLTFGRLGKSVLAVWERRVHD
jgi:SAM-dependent methyltransferase